MYGKTFQTLWRGSMRGKANLQLGFIYMFSNCDRYGVFDCVHGDIADATGLPLDVVMDAITSLEGPDPESRTEGHEGRRIIRLDKHRTWGWSIPNHEKYRREGSDENKREKAAERQRKHREKHGCNALVTPSHARNAITDTDTDTDTKKKPKSPTSGSDYTADFIRFWQEYPNKAGKKKAFTAWKKATDKPDIETLIKTIHIQKQSEAWVKDNGTFIPHPATWLNAGRWDDVVKKYQPDDEPGRYGPSVR